MGSRPKGLEQYNKINKIEPMNRAIQELGACAWLSGLRKVNLPVAVDLKYLKNNTKPIKFTLLSIGVIVNI